MASSLNEVTLIGNLTKDPELKKLPGGKCVCTVSLAMNKKWKDDQNKTVEKVTFVDVALWDRTGEIAHEFLKKGQATYIRGHIELDVWDDKTTGKKRSALKVVGDDLILLPNGGGGKATGKTAAASASASEAAPDASGSEEA